MITKLFKIYINRLYFSSSICLICDAPDFWQLTLQDPTNFHYITITFMEVIMLIYNPPVYIKVQNKYSYFHLPRHFRVKKKTKIFLFLHLYTTTYKNKKSKFNLNVFLKNPLLQLFITVFITMPIVLNFKNPLTIIADIFR